MFAENPLLKLTREANQLGLTLRAGAWDNLIIQDAG